MKKFRVEVIAKTPNPQQVIYAAMHQDYSEGFVYDSQENWPSEAKCGDIIVKRLLAGERGHYGCYSADTEVLTKDGWKEWGYVNKDDFLLSVDIISGFCKFEQPKNVYKYQVQKGDKLYFLQSQYMNFLVTHDHRMVISYRKKDGTFSEWKFALASEIYNQPVRYLLSSYLLDAARQMPVLPEKVDLIALFKLAGFFFGDGLNTQNISPRVIRFRLTCLNKIKYLYSLGFSVVAKKGERYVIAEPSIAKWIYENFSENSRKVIPIWVLLLPIQMAEALWDGLKNSDGTKIKEETWAFDSTEKQQLDILQAMLHINGFSANMTLNNPNLHNDKHKPCWRIYVSKKITKRIETCQNRTSAQEDWINYDGYVYCATVSSGALMVRRNNKVFISGNCLEHPQITFNCGYFPHSVMQQARTHRISITFDVQSMRYTGNRIIELANGIRNIEEVFYLRPIGFYSDRFGKQYEYTAQQRESDLQWCQEAAKRYQADIQAGHSEEHARGKLPFDYRQHFVVSFNLRSALHFLDLRSKKDAQLEIQELCKLIWSHIELWVPAIAEYYKQHRLGKARLAP